MRVFVACGLPLTAGVGRQYPTSGRECLKRFAALTGCTIIIYQARWLPKTGRQGFQVN
jgi:hypothetical protein